MSNEREFHPAFDMPTTRAEALACVAKQGDPLCMTHDPKRMAAAARLLAEPSLSFDVFRQANVTRCVKWHPLGISSWSPSDWLTACMGELGELASEVKTFNRERDGLIGNKEELTPEERKQRMANEAADVVTYLDLFCAERGIDLGAAIVTKFNAVSERVGLPDRITLK